ncbi:hypothetical protein FVE85_5329 [Porphyridium purpureum]|uniref:Uncharacterized protein n=1 Tax=Porphyridium purpureum TaxID=35688 RepID=A0A5J4Z483_PORPP|nr:hypothetical protein FVE85_5329 [Porphyridium purpureum]|eukprot:POR8987..scf295_1
MVQGCAADGVREPLTLSKTVRIQGAPAGHPSRCRSMTHTSASTAFDAPAPIEPCGTAKSRSSRGATPWSVPCSLNAMMKAKTLGSSSSS